MTEPIRAKKSLGQNFLTDPHFLRKIVEAAKVGPDDQVVEIGPGLGHLTRELAERAGKLVVIELDDRLIPGLREQFASRTNVDVVHGDALEFDYGSLSGIWKVVANLPYYISTPLIQRLIACRGRFSALTLMLQKEVAARVAAVPGGKEYGYLSVLVQYSAAARIEFTVPAAAFSPRPKVDSAVVTLLLRERPEHAVQDEDFFLQVIKAAFSLRRKTLRNSLQQLGFPRDLLAEAASDAGIDLGRRAETLSVREFGLLADRLAARKAAEREQRSTENT
jgi:16S rRNA (adenine1518-N6/adenine1519-N6)-dimethyltransferase